MTPINGLVLAGGRSSRMGHDKGLIDYFGKPQREHVFGLLVPYCAKIYTSCKTAANVPEHLNPLPDGYDVDSPLNGILSAFQLQPGDAWLTVPVDMPYVDTDVIRFLLTHRHPDRVATCFWNQAINAPEPLLTIWEAHARKPLMEYFEKGGRKPKEFLQHTNVHVVAPANEDWLLSINTPQEAEQFKSYVEKAQKPPI